MFIGFAKRPWEIETFYRRMSTIRWEVEWSLWGSWTRWDQETIGRHFESSRRCSWYITWQGRRSETCFDAHWTISRAARCKYIIIYMRFFSSLKSIKSCWNHSNAMNVLLKMFFSLAKEFNWYSWSNKRLIKNLVHLKNIWWHLH